MFIAQDRNSFTMRAPDNWHVHPRQGILMDYLIAIFIMWGWRHRIVAEPNTIPPKLTGAEAIEYGEAIRRCARQIPGGQTLEPVVTIQITEETTPQTVREAFAMGVRVFKVYPRYVTTHSENGVVDYFKIYPALAVIEELGGIVQFHAEHPSYDVMGRLKESAFREILDGIRRTFPRLKISIEHVSSEDMILWVLDQPENVGAGIAVQYLYLTSDDLAGYSKRSGGLVCPHLGAVKPGAKDPSDREAVRKAALSGNRKFWIADDDAWHLRSKKECAQDACGLGNTIASLSLLISFYESHDKLPAVEPILSEFGALFYGYPLNEGTATFVREEWVVPEEIPIPELNDSLVPWFAREKMGWKFVG